MCCGCEGFYSGARTCAAVNGGWKGEADEVGDGVQAVGDKDRGWW